MTTSIEERLQHYLDRIAAGESVDGLLPEIEAEPEGAELARLVALSARAGEVLPQPMAAARRGRMQAELQAAFREAHPQREERRAGFLGAWLRPVPRLTALVLAFVLLATTGVVVRAEDSVPGDALYPVKRVTESARVVFTVDPLRRARLQLRLADRRLDELQRLADRGAAIDAELIEALMERHAEILDQTQRLDDPDLAAAARAVMQKHRLVIGALAPSIEDPEDRERVEEVGESLRDIEEKLPTAVAAPSEDAPDLSSPDDPPANRPAPGSRKARITPSPGSARATSVRALPTLSPVPPTPTELAGSISPQPGPSLLPPGSTALPPSAEPPGSVMTAMPGTPVVRPTRPLRETAEARATEREHLRKATQRAERRKKATQHARERERRIRMTEEAKRRDHRATEEARRRELRATREAEQTLEPGRETPTPPRDRPPRTPGDLPPNPPPGPSPTDEPEASATP